MSIRSLRIKVGTVLGLGVINILRVLMYRVRSKLGLGASSARPVEIPEGDFFRVESLPPLEGVQPLPFGDLHYFGWMPLELQEGKVPDWFLNPFNGKRFPSPEKPWYQLPDFDTEVGDIKCIWEFSRWDWVLRHAQEYRFSGHADVLQRLNLWMKDWVQHNPSYMGPNWKCGQEASIRVMHLAFAARMLQQVDAASPALVALLRVHLRRIAPTIQYAIAQDNNHGTSEAAALYIGGHWLCRLQDDPEASAWAEQGRYWLENRVRRLVMPDGSFSQYSLNYHRVMLDTLSMVEVWRRDFELPPFSALYQGRAAAAACWLHQFTLSASGDGPNLGANDGARLLPLLASDYRDYRSSVQQAVSLFVQKRAYAAGPWDQQLHWLGLELPGDELQEPVSAVFDDGGYAVLRSSESAVFLRYPRFRFRPAHADALHLDLWHRGVNYLRDGGTYGYNSASDLQAYFPGTASHNTVQFDDRDQMPRLSRFLFGAWLRTSWMRKLEVGSGEVSFAAAYRDWCAASHRREVTLSQGGLRVLDTVDGFKSKAVLRWRLVPGEWRLDGQRLMGAGMSLSIQSGDIPLQLRLVTGLESRYYQNCAEIPVLECEVSQPCTLTSQFSWS